MTVKTTVKTMRVNIGCGEFYADGWVNVDTVTNDEVRPDMIGSLLELPTGIHDVEAVYLGHVLEHVAIGDAMTGLRRLWRRCVSGCKVAVVGPDVVRAWELVMKDLMTMGDAIGATLGARRWPGDEHRWVCYESRLLDLMRSSSLSDVRAVSIRGSELEKFPVTSRAPWQCAVVGTVQ